MARGQLVKLPCRMQFSVKFDIRNGIEVVDGNWRS
jgi:hypothetical protein